MSSLYRWCLCTGAKCKGGCVKVVSLYRWCLCTGAKCKGGCVKVSSLYRLSLCIDCLSVQVALCTYRWSVFKWPTCTDGLFACTCGLSVHVVCVQVAYLYMWSLCTRGLSVKVVSLYRWSVYKWPICTCGLSVQVVSLYRW